MPSEQTPPVPFTRGFRIDIRQGSAAVIVAPNGELDLLTAPLLLDAARDAEGDGQAIELDFAAVAFIDSEGLRALIELTHRSRDSGRSVQIRNLQPQVLRVIEITGLLDLLPVVG